MRGAVMSPTPTLDEAFPISPPAKIGLSYTRGL
jgi:hypothetical protein